VPVGGGVAGLAGGVQVPLVAGRDEPGRRAVGHAACPAGVQLLEDRHRRQQLLRAGPAGKRHGVEHVGGELPQVGVGGVQHAELAVVAWQPRPRLRERGPQPRHADPRPQQPADLLVGDGGVQQDRQDRVQQRLTVLARLGPLDQLLVGLVPGSSLASRHRLVEQLDHLVQHVGRRLRQQGQQDRVAALRLAPLQRLVGRPAPHRGQEPAPLGRQHRQVHGVGVQPPQEPQLGKLGLHRPR
jgi:hypothetical protein